MRVALCISGQPRFLEKGYEHLFKNLIQKNKCDVFLHTWFDNKKTNWDTQWSVDIHREELDKKIVELYQPKKYIIEEQKDILTKPLSEYTGSHLLSPVHIMFSMFYSIKTANDLKSEYEQENGFKYDCVIRTRFDGGILKELDVSQYDLTQPNIYYVDAIFNPSVICDWLFFGNSSVMDTVSSVFHFLDKYYEEKCLFCGEELLTNHLKKNRIGYNRIPISFFLVRDSEFSDKSHFGKFH